MSEQQHKPATVADDEIDLIALAKTIWNGRRKIIITTIIFMMIGLVVALVSPKEYTASTTMVPQSSDGKKIGGSLGGLAAMAGINLGGLGAGGDISPSLYPHIVNSVPFQKEMLKTMLTFSFLGKPVTFYDYYTEIVNPGPIEKYTIGLPDVIRKSLKGKNKQITKNETIGIPTITEEERKVIEILSSQLSLSVNDKDGYISLSANMPEALPAAQLAKRSQLLLQQTIIQMKSQKAREQLEFIEERFAEKKNEFEAIQARLAEFSDRNKNVTTAVAQTEKERLQADYNLTYGVYSELAKQVESQKLQVKEDTPIFTVLKPVSVPIKKSKPNRPLIIIIWIMIGGMVGIGLVFAKELFSTLRQRWNKN
ncbi:exopolysaccharide biosynthesis protein [Puteibacter caeruleilacunae]|nr:exopolysaccharide biosynthesis protein [Puteibacter caeruleilacunae]